MTTTEADTGLIARAKEITAREIARYAERTAGSQKARVKMSFIWEKRV